MSFHRAKAHASRTAGAGAPTILVALTAAAAAVLFGLAIWAFLADRTSLLFAVVLAGPIVALVLYRSTVAASLDARRLARTDRLTGLGNDRAFVEQLDFEVDRAAPNRTCLTLCLIDVDDFKRVNDRFGHPAGDRVLAGIGGCLRAGGEAFRLGGDEFALLLPGYDEAGGRAVAEAVLERVAATDYGHGGRVTASGGIVTYPQHTLDRGELVRLADRALYSAKRSGKACALVYRYDMGDPSESWQAEGERSWSALLRARTSAVGNIAARVAGRMGFTAEHVELIRVAGSLNDIGKLALPNELLSKAGPLTEEERRALERHPEIGYRILDSLGADPVATWILHHHERWDGAGYPERLSGERIPLGARVLFAADAYEAMTTDQTWRRRLTPEEALAELERCAGSQFDPVVVAAFVEELATRDTPAGAGTLGVT